MMCFCVSEASDRRLKFHFLLAIVIFLQKLVCVSMERLWVFSEDVVFAEELNQLVYGPPVCGGKKSDKNS